ncbi:hypothetical protein EES39_39460 [Streptomyces sp. ADI92-24]|nr:hypothetical protein EES39_39460 [Streptomyces sp. ADI92-24]
MMGAASRHRGMYIAFNKPIALEAKARLGSNVHCSTSHGLAYRAVGSRFQARLEATRHMRVCQKNDSGSHPVVTESHGGDE